MTDVDLSLGEYQALVAKALRGVGFSWGMAEEGGSALRQLAAWGVDAVANLVELLDHHDKSPVLSEQCPLHVGATLADRGSLTGSLTVATVEPVLIAPFLASIAMGGVMAMSWPGGGLRVSDTGLDVTGTIPSASVTVTIEPSEGAVSGAARSTRLVASAVHVQSLETYAARTYAPATEESRVAGAGASALDND